MFSSFIISLHDPHCKRLFLNNQRMREHLIQLGLLTDDLRVISTTKEQRQKIKAHELLERKEQLIQVRAINSWQQQ